MTRRLESDVPYLAMLLAAVSTLLGGMGLDASAQTVTTSITSSGLNTTVTPGATETVITGGTRAGGNLFHSLGNFSVAQGHTATFNNETAIATQNIISRVTGGNVSNIFGTVRTQNFGAAALWLVNPAGVVFGPSAALNVGGSVHVSTADYLRLGTGNEFFYADLAKNSTLSTASVTAFGFLGPAAPRAIDVRGATLSVPVGASLSLVGGHSGFTDAASGTTLGGVRVSGGSLNTATNGTINVVSVGAPSAPTATTGGEVPISLSNVTGAPTGFAGLGALSIQNATLYADAFGSSGAVYIRGGALTLQASNVRARDQVTITGSRSSASTMSMAGGEVSARAVTIEDMGTVTIDGTTATTLIQAFNQATFQNIESITLLDGRTFDPSQTTASRATIESLGNATFSNIGTLTIDHGAVTGVNLEFSNIDALSVIGTSRAGQDLGSGGIEGQVTPVVNGSITSSSLFCCGGTPGNISFTDIGRISVQGGLIATTTETASNAGTIVFQGIGRMDVNGVITSNTGNPESLTETNNNNLGFGNAGTVSFTDVGTLNVGRNGQISSRTKGGAGDAGTLSFTDIGVLNVRGLISASSTSLRAEAAAGNILFDGIGLMTVNGGQINSRTLGNGPAGTISLQDVNRLTVQNNGVIRTNTTATGDAGDITIGTTGAGVNTFGSGSTHARTAFERVAGEARLDAVSLTGGGRIESKSALSSGTTDSDTPIGGGYDNFRTDPAQLGDAGTITLRTGRFSMSGGVMETSTEGAGQGNDIAISARTITLGGGARISTGSTGTGTDSPNIATYTPGDAGSIALTSATDIILRDSQIQTTAAQASGGNIKLTAPDTVLLDNARITSSVNGPIGSNGGNISIDPIYVILMNGSQILAQAFGGNGGNISIVSNTFLTELGTTIDASSQLGISGQVVIQSPIQNLAGAIAPLPQAFVSNANLYGQRCAAQKVGQFSSFIEGTRDALPPQPGDFLSSPLPSSGGRSSMELPMSAVNAARLGIDMSRSSMVVPLALTSGCHS
jgi:filamentous hemagglutinin family protein